MYHRAMRRQLSAILILGLLAGCSWTRKYISGGDEAGFTTPQYALPGVPLGEDPSPARAAVQKAEPPAAPSAAGKSAEVPAKPEPVTAAEERAKYLDFHLSAAVKYYDKRQYRSAAAEYGAALDYLAALDARAVDLLEHQGSMLLKAGDIAKAGKSFQAAIEKGKELKASGRDLSESYRKLGYCMERENKAQEAISNYEEALEFTTSKTMKDNIAQAIATLKKNQKAKGR